MSIFSESVILSSRLFHVYGQALATWDRVIGLWLWFLSSLLQFSLSMGCCSRQGIWVSEMNCTRIGPDRDAHLHYAIAKENSHRPA